VHPRRPTLADALQRIRARIAAACARSGRSPEDVTLMLATKTVPAERIIAAYRAGATLVGENRVQEALAKHEALAAEDREAAERITWHMIGHLQTNKIKHALRFASCVQSVDRVALVDKLQHHLTREERRLDVFIQVNTSGEASKFGVVPGEARALIEAVQGAERLRLRGLMTIGKLGSSPEAARPGFAVLHALRDELLANGALQAHQTELSMGMSSDFEIAIEEGATLVRVGTAVFGERPTPDSYYWPEL